MLEAVLFQTFPQERELGRGYIRGHNGVLVRKRVHELQREYPAADWVELWDHTGERVLSCNINRLYEINSLARIGENNAKRIQYHDR